jgi:glycosyltransferase involved in cell wall biosynthesis
VANGSLPRIALVAPSLEIVGGQSIEAFLLARALREDRYEVTQLAVNPRLPKSLQWVRRLRVLRTLAKLAFFLPTLLRLTKCDVVHVFSASYWSFLLGPGPAMVAGRLFGKKVVLHYHSGEAAHHLASWGILFRPWLALADEIVVPSSYLAEIFDEAGHFTKVIPNVIRLEDFPFREPQAAQSRLLSTRNLEPHYAVATVIKAFPLIKRRYPNASLTIAGWGSEGRSLQVLARSLADGDIRFVGQVPPDRIPSLLEQADVFLNASVIDNQPLSILEAFATGVPVVTTSTGAIAELVRDGRTATLVRADDPQSLADAACELLANPARAVTMTRRARKQAEQYSWPSVRGLWARVYGCAGVQPEPPVATRGAIAS